MLIGKNMEISTHTQLKILKGTGIFVGNLFFSIAWFLILPLKFEGPTFDTCHGVGSTCTAVYTTRWHWLGMYHIWFSPEGPHYPAVMNYVPVNTAEQRAAFIISILLGVITYMLLRKIILRIFKSHTPSLGSSIV